jgi:hypothetical protein
MGRYLADVRYPDWLWRKLPLRGVPAGKEIVTVPLWGHLRMKEEAGGRDQRLETVRLEGQALSFATQEIDGVSYAFEGDFLVAGELPAQAPQGVVLQGRLRRLDRGRPAGELDASFLYTPGD